MLSVNAGLSSLRNMIVQFTCDKIETTQPNQDERADELNTVPSLDISLCLLNG